MRQILTTTLISFVVIALFAAGGFWFVQREAAKGAEPEMASISDAEMEQFVEQLEAADTGLPASMDEPQLQIHLHEMTHSKVYAKDKWGTARPMTQKNIDELLAIVEANDFKEKAFYRNTLEDWKKGDFSNAVDVHNTIWDWHGGSIGKATRLMTAEEEQAYIRSNF